jgi:hypothetical protein
VVSGPGPVGAVLDRKKRKALDDLMTRALPGIATP